MAKKVKAGAGGARGTQLVEAALLGDVRKSARIAMAKAPASSIVGSADLRGQVLLGCGCGFLYMQRNAQRGRRLEPRSQGAGVWNQGAGAGAQCREMHIVVCTSCLQ